MRVIEIARRLAALGQSKDACQAYTLAVNETEDPAERMEAAVYVLQSGGDYRVSYTCFLDLYRQGLFREDILSLADAAFYEPNRKELRGRYERNIKLLKNYPYLFRKDFVPFEDLPIRFYPYDEDGYIPFDRVAGRFGAYINFKNPVVSRNFFKDLEKPILADDVYSQYELEYLNDNVRPSEYIGRENHIYLHYTDWGTFCSYLACLNLRPLLLAQKVVFLIGDEISRYPIDFKKDFGIDYSRYPIRPVGIREVQRMIWHTQLATHNGGDFFNEIFDDHPNLLMMHSYILEKMEDLLKEVLESMDQMRSSREAVQAFEPWNNPRLVTELYSLRDRTSKDALVALYLREKKNTSPHLDEASRIAPAIFFQPHFYNVTYLLEVDEKDRAKLYSREYEQIENSPVFRHFKYIKTFTPMRRITTSHAASVKFMLDRHDAPPETENGQTTVIPDAAMIRVLNRSFMIDWQDRLHRDSVLVRFEDGKLNPRATFAALTAFLDIPYTESMTYCSYRGEQDPESMEGNARGFDPAPVYRTYDEYATDAERTYLEYFMRDAYEYYGYDFHYYDGGPVDMDRVRALLDGFTILDRHMRNTYIKVFEKQAGEMIDEENRVEEEARPEAQGQMAGVLLEGFMEQTRQKRLEISEMLLQGLRFVNKNGQPLRMMPRLELDPALLEQPLYH